MLRLWAACVMGVASASGAAAQSMVVPAPFSGGVATGEVRAQPLSLSLSDAMKRGLQYNLGVLAQEQGVRDARGARWRALSELLPRVDGRISETRQVVNLAAFGFKGFAGLPQVVGPFNVFDARVSLSQPVFDLAALNGLRAEGHTLASEQYGLQDARQLVVLVVTDLYLEAVTSASRLEAAKAQLSTADALFQQATDLKAAGLVAGIDVVRADVERSNERQRVIAAQNDVEKRKLVLARAIGLPLAQVFTLVDRVPETPAVVPVVSEAVSRARTARPDYLAAEQRMLAAEATRHAATAEAYPTVHVDANYGSIGLTPDSARPSYAVAGSVQLSIFDGARRARVIQADAELKRRKDELADFASRVEYDVRAAVLDVESAEQQLSVARSGVELAGRELTQARDRFGAGVADNIEVVRAQESVAAANERLFESVYRHGLARVALGRAMGLPVEDMTAIVGTTPNEGKTPNPGRTQ
jgi:outer membrane protein TolC